VTILGKALRQISFNDYFPDLQINNKTHEYLERMVNHYKDYLHTPEGAIIKPNGCSA